MLKRSQPDRGTDLSSLVSSRNAVQFLYEESLANGNADITPDPRGSVGLRRRADRGETGDFIQIERCACYTCIF